MEQILLTYSLKLEIDHICSSLSLQLLIQTISRMKNINFNSYMNSKCMAFRAWALKKNILHN